MESLYRFISFPTFVSLVEQKQERYVLPTSWEDTFEGYLFRLLDKDEIENCLNELAHTISQDDPELAAINYLKLYNARWYSYGQCWTKCRESDALWRIYSYDKMAVRIETDEEQIRKVLSHIKEGALTIDDVRYDLDNEDGVSKSKEQLLTELSVSKRVPEPYFHKRRAFEHEKEKRVVFFDPTQSQVTTLMRNAVLNNYRIASRDKDLTFEERISMLSAEIEKIHKKRMANPPTKMQFHSIENINGYIKSVMVHPQAEEWIVKLVECICQREELNFVGKSKMYAGLE